MTVHTKTVSTIHNALYEWTVEFSWEDNEDNTVTWIDFAAWRCIGGDKETAPVYEDEDEQPVFHVHEAAIYAHGHIKWDGCSNWHIDEQDSCMLHFCGLDMAHTLSRLATEVYDFAKMVFTNPDF